MSRDADFRVARLKFEGTANRLDSESRATGTPVGDNRLVPAIASQFSEGRPARGELLNALVAGADGRRGSLLTDGANAMPGKRMRLTLTLLASLGIPYLWFNDRWSEWFADRSKSTPLHGRHGCSDDAGSLASRRNTGAVCATCADDGGERVAVRTLGHGERSYRE